MKNGLLNGIGDCLSGCLIYMWLSNVVYIRISRISRIDRNRWNGKITKLNALGYPKILAQTKRADFLKSRYPEAIIPFPIEVF